MSTPPPILLGSLGMTDSLILMVMALVVFGPRRLPQIGRQIGKLMYEFRKASNDFKFQMEEELRNSEEAERRKKEEERQRALAAQNATEQASVSAQPAAAVNAIESGEAYSGETAVPAQATVVEEKIEETVPQILPPSTGEIVAASRPGPREPQDAGAVEATPSVEDSTAIPGATAEGLPKQDDGAAAEAVNHHG